MGAHGSIYHRLLEMTRAFATTKLAQRGEANRIARRHAIFCSTLLRQEKIVESRFSQYDLSEYSVHIGNVRAALEWAFSEHGDLAIGVELAVGAAPLLVGLSLLTECVRWCERALASLDGGAGGGQQEMILQEALALSSMYTGGHSNKGRAAFERGLALEEKIGDSQHQLQIFFSLYRLLLRRGEFRAALAMAEQGRTLAEATQDPAGLLVADFMLGAAHNYNGDQAAAQFHSERAMTRATQLGAAVPNFFGFDYHSYGHVLLARCLALHGFADRAREAANAGLKEAMRREHPLSIILALHQVALISLWIGDLRIANRHVEKLIDYVERHSIEPYRVAGLGLKGALAVARNDNETGVELLQSALEILAPKKLTFLLSGFIGALADGLRKMGQFEAALYTINRAIAWATETGLAVELADLLRIKADILAAIPNYGRMPALSCVREAIAVARKQSALALELRSTVTLARFLSQSGERDQARQELSLVCGRFTEGFKTPDFTAARHLIEALA
jgi:predicted ATPase